MAPKKRKSSEGLDAGKKLKVSGGKPDPGKLQTMLHVGKLSEWLLEKVMPVGGPSAYLATMYPDQDSLLKFAEWIDTFAPADGSKVYASSTDRPCLLRPWMLGFRSDFGVSGFLDPEVGELLLQLILTEGFSSDPDRVGAEKLSMTAVPKAYLEAEYVELPACIGSGMLPPFSCAYVKGWKRGVTLLIALHGIRELGLEGEIPHWVKVTFGTIHASFGTFADDTKGKVMANRGATLQHTATRRPPHCFNFLRQVEIIERSGGAGVLQQMEEWTNATSLAKAFSLGKLESEAIFNLRLRVPAAVLKVLTEAVKQRGLAKLLTHDVIARDCFNQNFSSGVNAMEQWKEELRNRDGNELALLFVQRLLSDHDSTPPQLRKPLTFREALGKHQACGGFLHYLRLLQQMAPAADYPEMEKDLKQQFRYGYLDPDILHSLETMVPPGDIQMVGAFRTYVARVEQSARSEKMKREADLAANVRAADLTQLLARLEADMELLSSKENNSASRAAETAKDMKYLWDRQLKGERWVDEWMAENCKLLECDQDMHAAMPGLLAFKEQFRGIAGKEYIMCTYDCTVFPSNATYVRQTGLCASNILSLSSGAFCHLQFPVYQPQTSASAVLKHRRILEDQFMRSNLNILLPVQLLFSKAEGGARDNRSLNQPCLALLHNNFEASEWQRSEPVQQGKIGPVPLLRFSDFLGYDDTTRPSSQGRVEQKGVDAHMGIISSYMQGMEIKPEDRLIICDILPNKQFEFGRAVVQQRLAEPTSPWRYIGFVKKLDGAQPSALGDILKALRSQVWDFWDSSSHAPPKTRPQEGGAGADAVPDLQVLAFQGGHPVWPEVLLNRFPEGTSEHDALMKQEEFLRKFPRAPEVSSSRATGLPPRAGGLCDFSIDNGLRPLDVTKQVSLTCVKESDFTVTRLGSCAMRSGRPALVLTSTYDLWVGNTSDNVVNLDAGELFGFSTGNYEEVTFPSGVLVEPSGLLLRFTSDLQLIVSEEKKIMALCEYLRFLATEKGIGSLTIEDHKMEPRMHEAEAGREAMPICFRYQISCLDSGKTHMFKPNAFDSESPTPTHRTFGALYNSAYDKVARNDFARVLWEVETSSSPPVVMAKKPKMYLTCSLSMEPRSWYKLT